MPKNRLQLVGVTCLFVGAKIEEIYPPKLNEFAYVTDGACTEDEILSMELVVIKTLNWGLSPMTPNGWMKMYMQVAKAPTRESFVSPQFSGSPFVKAMQLLDLVTLDMDSMSFPYSVLAATAFAITQENRAQAMAVSGYSWPELAKCHKWMSVFWDTLKAEPSTTIPSKVLHNVNVDNQHNIQTHSVDLQLLERVQEAAKRVKARELLESPPCRGLKPAPIPRMAFETPPDSIRDVRFIRRTVSSSTATSLFASSPASSTASSSVFLTPDPEFAIDWQA